MLIMFKLIAPLFIELVIVTRLTYRLFEICFIRECIFQRATNSCLAGIVVVADLSVVLVTLSRQHLPPPVN